MENFPITETPEQKEISWGLSIIDIVRPGDPWVVLFPGSTAVLDRYLSLKARRLSFTGQIWRIIYILVYPPAITGSDAIMFCADERPWHCCIHAFGTIALEQV